MAINRFPLVSIITPVYNGAEYLEALIQSVLQQDYPNIEHLVIDDGSQDKGATVAILKKFPRLRWWSHENKGQYATMNEGLLAAQGEYVCFVSADDIMTPGAITAAVSFLQEKQDYDGVFGMTGYIDPDGNDSPYFVPFRNVPICFYPYFAHISHCSLYVRRLSLLEHKLLFEPSLRFIGDYDWIVRIYKSGLRIGVINRQLSKVRIHASQTTQTQCDAIRLEKYEKKRKILEDYNVNKVVYFLLSNAYIMQFRAWKVGLILRESGAKGVVKRLVRRYKK